MSKIKNQDIVEAFVASEEYIKNLVYCREYDSFYLWRDYYFKLLTGDEIRGCVRRFTLAAFPNINITLSLLNDIIGQIKLSIPRDEEGENTGYIAFKDRYFNLNTFTAEPTDKSLFVTFQFPYNYAEIDMEIPVFKSFLNTSIVKKEDTNKTDGELLLFVQEMFGSFIVDNLDAAAAFFLVGGGANGKSIITDTLRRIFTREFCSAMSIQALTTDKFSTQHLIGKKINISSEEESKYIKSDKFKGLVTGDLVEAERKFGDKFEFIPKAKYLFASNQMPTFEGINYGLKRRIKIIPFYRRFIGRERDMSLKLKLERELPGIMGWMIEGAKRLVANDYEFTKSIASLEALEEFENETSSSLRFVRENYMLSAHGFIAGDTIYQEYKDWCMANGNKYKSKNNFLKDITDNIDGIQKERHRIDGRYLRGFNLTTLTDFENKYDGTITDDVKF